MEKKKRKNNATKRLKRNHSKQSPQATSKKKLNAIPITKVLFDFEGRFPKNDQNGNTILEGFTLHPPKEVIQDNLNKRPAYITDMELFDLIPDKQVFIGLKMKKGPYEKTKNPVYLIEAFLLAHENGIYPPMWVLNFMAEVFKKYHSTLGEISLDKLFGFKGWRGQEPAFKSIMKKEERDEMLMKDIFSLHLLGYSIEDASHMVARKLEQSPKWDKTGLKLGGLSAKTMEFMYKKKWNKILNNEFFINVTKKRLQSNKDNFLETFPPDSFPHHKRKRASK